MTGNGSATGIGDVTFRVKANVISNENVGVALAVDVRTPTGSAEQFLGSGAAGIRPFVAISGRHRFSPHLNLGYEWNDESILAANITGTTIGEDASGTTIQNGAATKRSLPSQLTYAAGADAGVTRRLTLSLDGLVHWMRVPALDQHIGLGAHDEERRAECEDVKALEIHVAAIHDVERSGLWQNLVEHVDVVHFAVCNAYKRWDIAVQVQQGMQFDGSLVSPEASPWEQRKTQVDGGGIERVQACIQVDADRIAGVQRSSDGDQDLRKIREDPPLARFVGVRQSRARHLASKSHVVEFAADRVETRFDVTQAFAVCELSEAHCQKLVPTGKALLLMITVIPTYTLLELVPRKMLHELRENSLANVHPSLSAIANGEPSIHVNACTPRKS